MTGSSSARVEKRLTDGDVIVVEVIRELLLSKGLLGVFDISLRDEVVVGLITCGGVVLGQGARVLSSAEVRRVLIHDIKEGEGVGQQEQQDEGRDDEEGNETKGRSRRDQKQRSLHAWMTMG